MKAFITGATGFIGGALADSLALSGWDVSVLLRPGSRNRLTNPERFQIFEADLSQPDNLKAALSRLNTDVIVHAAAIRNRWGTPPDDYYKVNVQATQYLLDAIIGKTKRFVYLSSVGVYGRPGILGINEKTAIRVGKAWDYHSSKAAGEELTLKRNNNIETVVIRPTITYGPGDTDGMVTKLIQMVNENRYFRIGHGENHIHLTYIDDLIEGLRLAMTHSAAPGNIFIFAGPEPTKMNTIIQLIEGYTQVKLPAWQIPENFARFTGSVCEKLFRFLPNRWEPPITRDKVDNICVNRGFSWEKAAQKLGYQPQFSIEEGLDQTVAWLN